VPGTVQCQETITGSDGSYSVPVPIGASVVLTAYPLANSGDTATSTNPLPVPADGIQGETISLDGVTPLPSGLLVNGTDAPTVYWADPASESLTGCPNGTAYVTVEGENAQTGLRQTDIEPHTENPVGSGTYTGTISAQGPMHGPVSVGDQIFCPSATLSAVEPSVGAAGPSVLVSGSGFTGATAVDFGTALATSFTVDSDSLVEAVVPAGQGDAGISVSMPDGLAALDGDGVFSYFGVASVSPDTGPAAGGTTVDIIGAGFTDADSVDFGANEAESVTVVSDTEIQAVVPSGAGTVDVNVTNAGLATTAAAAGAFTYSGGGSQSSAIKVPVQQKSVVKSAPSALSLVGSPDEATAAQIAAIRFRTSTG
jgi:hypothetical protein